MGQYLAKDPDKILHFFFIVFLINLIRFIRIPPSQNNLKEMKTRQYQENRLLKVILTF
jgi:hypothetical protein